jgi:ATP-dependent Clp protease protease subunit
MNFTNEFTKFSKDLGLNDSQINHQISMITPHIVEERTKNVAIMSVFDRLMQDRIIFFGGPVTDPVANVVIAQLLFLENLDSKKDITMYLNSPGGSVQAGLGIYDTMNMINPDVVTVNVGMSASMGAVLLSSGQKGKRYTLKHSRTMIHQPLGGTQGKATDMEIQMEEMKKLRKELYDILSINTGKSFEQIEKDCNNGDKWFTGQEAVEYGLVDEVVTKK